MCASLQVTALLWSFGRIQGDALIYFSADLLNHFCKTEKKLFSIGFDLLIATC